MKSHTVPKRLLRQFSYYENSTKSLRLWRYEKDRAPYPKASPDTATRIPGHFEDPSDESTEAHIEKRLAYEIEDPVNQFIANFADSKFTISQAQKHSMTRYVTLLFNRSRARKEATKSLLAVRNHSLERLLQNQTQLATVAAHWNIKAHFEGKRFGRLISSDDVARRAQEFVKDVSMLSASQEWYEQSVVRALTELDDQILNGQWGLIKTTGDRPFVLSDAPVVTWERLESGAISHGVGFHRPNVEVALPVSPLTCLHILPDVKRSRAVKPPTVDEINRAEIGFAHESCFTNVPSKDIDLVVQQSISSIKIGKNAFTMQHRNYDNAFYELLMNNGKWVDPPLRK